MKIILFLALCLSSHKSSLKKDKGKGYGKGKKGYSVKTIAPPQIIWNLTTPSSFFPENNTNTTTSLFLNTSSTTFISSTTIESKLMSGSGSGSGSGSRSGNSSESQMGSASWAYQEFTTTTKPGITNKKSNTSLHLIYGSIILLLISLGYYLNYKDKKNKRQHRIRELVARRPPSSLLINSVDESVPPPLPPPPINRSRNTELNLDLPSYETPVLQNPAYQPNYDYIDSEYHLAE